MTATEAFKPYVLRMMKNMKGDFTITPENVFQKGVLANREIIGEMVDEYTLPGSGIIGIENFKKFYEYCKQGKSCLILMEHYGNLDYPFLIRYIEQNPQLGKEVADSILPIQGMKLSTSDTSVTTLFAQSYDTIIIYPSRSLDSIQDENEKAEARKISNPINHAAMKHLIKLKHEGRMILVFPAGTRYRPWVPESKKGVREIYSYLKTFDYIIFAGLNGNSLVPSPDEDMNNDKAEPDVMFVTFSEPISGRQFREEVLADMPEGQDPRGWVVDGVMKRLEDIHEQMEEEYQSRRQAALSLK